MSTTKQELNVESHVEIVAQITPAQAASLIHELTRYIAEGNTDLRITLTKSYPEVMSADTDREPFLGLRFGVGTAGWGPSGVKVARTVVFQS